VISGVALLPGYQRAWLRGDVVAGVTVAAYLIPQVMAYATVADLSQVTGLWAALPASLALLVGLTAVGAPRAAAGFRGGPAVSASPDLVTWQASL
jgi:MFS superfamily sulfate permease-like transporter